MKLNYRRFDNAKQNTSEQIIHALGDFCHSLELWRVAFLMGVVDIRKRYTRSKIGQFWLTISFAIHIITVSIIWSLILKTKLEEYLPYFAFGHMLWCYVQSYITEGSLIYIGYSAYLRELNMPYFVYINSLVVKNCIVLLHNLPIILICFFLFYSNFNLSSLLLSLLGFILLSLFLTSCALIIGILSLRFRDLPNIINSLINIVFYATPIMWQVSIVPLKYQFYLLFNPIAVFIVICRDHWFYTVTPNYWWYGIFYTATSMCLALLVFAKLRNRITYWI